MGLRYYSEHRTYSGDAPLLWRVEIHDSTAAPDNDGAEFFIEAESCEIEWRGEGDDVAAPVLSSSCQFTMMMRDGDDEELINDLAGAKEGRFTVVIYRDSVFHWAGVINSPEISFEDVDFPYPFQITAVDGLALLKNYPHSQDTHRWSDVYEGQSNLITVIARSLKKLPHIVTHFEGIDKFIVTAINWYSDLHNEPVTDVYDPFFYTYVDNRIFAQGQASGVAKFVNCYDAISEVLRAFNARISLQDGYFLVEQLEHRAGNIGTDANFSRYYDYDLTEPLANTLDDVQPIGSTEDIKKLRGGTYSFLPGLRAVRVTQTLNGLQNLIPAFSASGTYAVGTVQGGEWPTTIIRFTGSIDYTLTNISVGTTETLGAVFLLKIELNSEALLRDVTFNGGGLFTYSSVTWDADLGSRIKVVVPITGSADGETATGQFPIDFALLTNIGFSSGDMIISFDFDHLEFLGSIGTVDAGDYDIEWALKNAYCVMYKNLSPFAPKSVTYQVTGEADNTQVEEIKTIFGDIDTDIVNYWGGFLFFDDPDYFYTATWGNRDGTRDKTIAQLLAERVLASQYFPRKILRGTTVGSPFVVQTPIEERSETFILKNGRYNTTRDEMAGEWVKLAYTAAEFAYEDAEYNTDEYEVSTPGGGGTTGGGIPPDNGGGGAPTGLPDGNGIYSESGTATDVTVTINGILSFESAGADDAFQVDMEGGGMYADSTTSQITFNDGGNTHSVGVTASGILINAPSAAADSVFIRAAGAFVKLQDIGGNVQVGGGTTESEARFMEASGNGTNYAAVKAAAALAANVTFVLPPTSGAANQLLGQNSGATGTEYKTLSGTTNQVTVTHGANSITLSVPQNIHTAATPTFSSLTLTNDLTVNDDISMTGGGIQTFTMNGGTANLFWMNGASTMQIGNGGVTQFYVNGDYGYLGVEPTVSGNDIDIRKFSASGSTSSDGQNILLSVNDGAALSNGHYLGSLYFRSRGVSSTLQTGAQISAVADGADWTNTSLPTKIEISVVSAGASTLSAAVTIRETKNTEFAGNVELTTTGAKVKIATGSNASMGTATLVGGTVTVNTTAVATGSTIFLTCNTPGGTQGFLSAPAASITNATSFVINSSSVADTSTVNWLIIN